MRSLASFIFILVVSSASAQSSPPIDRNALIVQTLQGQIGMLAGAGQLCQLDLADLKKQLDESRAELARVKKSQEPAK